ncbi:MAG: hypothetical protein AAGJ18_07975 [Bacteroidota bacterium]
MKNLLLVAVAVAILGLNSCGEPDDCCVLPPLETFSFAAATALGCGNFYLYKEAPQEKLHLLISGDRDELNLVTSEKTFDLDTPTLEVQMLRFGNEIGNYACDDVANDQGEVIETWTAIRGKVILQITEDSISVDPVGVTYRMTAKLLGMELENDQNEQIAIPEEVFEDVFVGWLPG